jgi:hypothetical protein
MGGEEGVKVLGKEGLGELKMPILTGRELLTYGWEWGPPSGGRKKEKQT